MSNSVDPDETAHYEPSHLDLRCLQMPIIIAYGSERVNVFREAAELLLKHQLIGILNHYTRIYVMIWNPMLRFSVSVGQKD